MERIQNRRKFRLVVEKDFQYRLTLRICLAATAVFLIFGGTLLFLVRTNYDMLVSNALLQMPEMIPSLQREFRLMSLGIVAVMILVIGILFGAGLLLTSQIAGPLYALKRQLKAFSEGQSGVRLSMRLGDEFLSLAETFNHAMENWDLKRNHLDTELRQTILVLEKGPKEAVIQKIEKLIHENKSGDSTSSGFRKS